MCLIVMLLILIARGSLARFKHGAHATCGYGLWAALDGLFCIGVPKCVCAVCLGLRLVLAAELTRSHAAERSIHRATVPLLTFSRVCTPRN